MYVPLRDRIKENDAPRELLVGSDALVDELANRGRVDAVRRVDDDDERARHCDVEGVSLWWVVGVGRDKHAVGSLVRVASRGHGGVENERQREEDLFELRPARKWSKVSLDPNTNRGSGTERRDVKAVDLKTWTNKGELVVKEETEKAAKAHLYQVLLALRNPEEPLFVALHDITW